jgi:hypothetical protein
MNTSKLSLVPLGQASLCLDCNMITSAHTHCFACGSVALLNLARTLNGGEYSDIPAEEQAAVTSISDHRTYEMPALVSVQPQWPRRLGGECVPFPHTAPTISAETIGAETIGGGTISAERQNTGPWRSFREVAAVVHRALTIAIIAILARGACTPVWGQTLGQHADAHSSRPQTHGHVPADPCGY